MNQDHRLLAGIEARFAAVQSSYWVSNCTIRTFLTIFLTYRGLTDAQIGYTTSSLQVTSIFLQLFISNWSDRHPDSSLKKTIAVLTIVSMALTAVLWKAPLSVLLMLLVYVLTCACDCSVDGLNNAMFMQYVNGGLRVRYGWPRGTGSIFYAAMAYVLGRVIERHTPDIILPVFLVTAAIALACVLLMPSPERVCPVQPDRTRRAAGSYIRMLRGNPTLVLLLCACIVLGAGVSALGTFLIRIVENVGGGTREFGIATFISAGVELPAMFLSGWMLRHFRPRTLLTVSFFANVGKLTIFLLARSLGMIYVGMAVSFFCFGLYGVSSVLFANSIVREDEKVRGQSLLSLCYTGGIGGILGNAASGLLLERFGVTFVLSVSTVLCLCGSMLMLLCVRSHRRRFTEETAKAES